MTPPTVDRFRYPFRRVVPGDPHTISLFWGDGSDLSASVFDVVMLDAFTAEPVTGVNYVIDDTDAETGLIVAVASIPAGIDRFASFEIRIHQDDETIIAGPVMFALAVVPVTP